MGVLIRLLLGTHTFFWALADPKRLGPTAAQVIRSRSTELVVSAFSAWELATKVRAGRCRAAERSAQRWAVVMMKVPLGNRRALR